MTQLQSAVVLITGAAGGFGQELIRQLLAKGSRLILTDRPAANVAAIAQQRLSSVLLQFDTARSRPTPCPGEILACLDIDLASSAGCEALYAATRQLDLPVDVLINNAGLAVAGAMTEIPAEHWETLMQVNLLAPMRLSTRFGMDMMARRRGHIVNISSLAGWIAPPGLTAYAASKFGLRGFSEGLRLELAASNIKVTTVYPCFSRTPMLQSPRFGSLAETEKALPPLFITDPVRIMARTIQAIEHDRAEVFPDAIAAGGHRLKRFFPAVATWISGQAFRSQ